jgi:hypothetical protein
MHVSLKALMLWAQSTRNISALSPILRVARHSQNWDDPLALQMTNQYRKVN